MRILGLSRRWLVAIGVVVGLWLLITIGIAVVYPRIAARMIREKLGVKLAAKLGREVQVGAIDVTLGHAIIRDTEIRGPLDGDMPLVHVERIDVDFDAWHSLVGTIELGAITIDGVIVSARREADGRDNVTDVVARLREQGTPTTSSGASLGTLRPTSISLRHAKLLADDAQTGTSVQFDDGTASWTPGEVTAEARDISATSISAPKAVVARLGLYKHVGEAPLVTVEGGELTLWPKLSLSGIGGKIVADPARAGEYVIDLAGGYGGVPGRLWTAKGGLDPKAFTASIDLEAAKFQLERLAPILEHSALVDYNTTSVDTSVHLDVDRTGAKFAGALHLSGLNIGHPLIAEKEVHDVDISVKVAGAFDRATRTLELTRGDFMLHDVPFSITGTAVAPRAGISELPDAPGDGVAQPGDVAADPGRPTAAVPRRGPHGLQIVRMRLVIPSIDCQRLLLALPPEMVPYMVGYKLRGVFDADLHVGIDWADLDATQLDGHIGINHCRVVDEPADSPKRLKDEFEHYVEVDKGEWTSFVVGPSNDDYVPIEDISPYLQKSIMSTEDSGFYHHHGFIPSEFRTALITNLKQGKFVQGASSITMQMVKNVLLYREKTLARKLQELFLTWHVENTLTKDRIFEIYLNVIEYGPGLYGIGPASREFFGKPPKDLNPVEAAFFSTILPAPKDRYRQYCAGTLTRWTTDKIQRILAIMLKRDRLTQAEYDTAMTTPLVFVKDGTETEEQCMKRVTKAIKNARPTNPLAPVKDLPPATKPPKHHDHDHKKRSTRDP